MRKAAATLCTLALCFANTGIAAAANAVRITQVYGGGGTSTGSYLYDYVELLNYSASSVDISGWVLEYGSATGNWGGSSGNIYAIPSGTVIPSCSYLLIQLGTAGTAGGALPATPDLTTTGLSMSQNNGKVALFNTTNSNLACGSEVAGSIVDKVSYGTGNCPEGTAAAALTSTTTLVRGGNYQDTDNNSTDFTAGSSPTVTMHNSASAKNATCTATTPAQSGTWGGIKSIYR